MDALAAGTPRAPTASTTFRGTARGIAMKVRMSLVLPGALAVGIAFAPLAHPDNESYLQWLISHGVVGDGAGYYSSDFALQTGSNSCAAIKAGKSDIFLMGQLIDAYEMGKAQAEDFVVGAHRYLCP